MEISAFHWRSPKDAISYLRFNFPVNWQDMPDRFSMQSPVGFSAFGTCTVAKSTGCLIQGRIALLTTHAGLVLGNRLP